MGFFDNLKQDKLGKNAYNVHVQANDLHRRGKVAEAKAKFAEALTLYDEAYAAGCRKTGILMSYSVLLMRSGEFARARELMKEISAIGGLDGDTHFELRINYSICLWRLGILDKAIETVLYAGKHSKNSSYYSALGTFLVEKAAASGADEDYEEARALLDEALDYDEDDAPTLDSYGEYYRQLSLRAAKQGDAAAAAGFRKQAVESYEKAYANKPGQITSLYALANFAYEDGNKEKAKEYVDRAIMHSSSRICPVSLEDLQALRAKL